jgi:hypothetical protein
VLWNAEQMHPVGCIEKNQISKQINEKNCNVKTQYYFAEQNNKHSEVN